MEYNFEDLNMAKMKLLLERYNSQQKAKKKYYEKNKIRLDEYAKNSMIEKYKNNEEFREKQKAYAREYKNKNKDNFEFKERQKRATEKYREKKKMIKKINELQNDPYISDFGELNLIKQ